MSLEMTEGEKKILESPVFIIGAERSGTTWLQRLIIEHSQVTGGQESNFFLIFAQCLGLKSDCNTDSREVGMLHYWLPGELEAEVLVFWNKTFVPLLRKKPSAIKLSEKTPTHALHVDKIAEFLPNAQFIHIIRDSRSVVASLNAARAGWGHYWAPKSTKKAAISWWRFVNAARTSGEKLPADKYYEVYYEDLLNDTYTELSKIYDFIGLKYTQTELDKIIQKQEFQNQKKLAGTGFLDKEGNELKEPKGFFRKGVANSWKSDLNIIQKLIAWRYTRKLMRKCGYNWSGRLGMKNEGSC